MSAEETSTHCRNKLQCQCDSSHAAKPTPCTQLVIASADSADGALWEGGPNRTMMASPKHGARLVCTYSNPDAMVIDEFAPEGMFFPALHHLLSGCQYMLLKGSFRVVRLACCFQMLSPRATSCLRLAASRSRATPPRSAAQALLSAPPPMPTALWSMCRPLRLLPQPPLPACSPAAVFPRSPLYSRRLMAP